MSHYWESVTTVRCHIGSGYRHIRTVDILRADNTCIVRYIQTIIGHKHIIIAITIYHFRSLGCLPSTILITGIDTFHHLVEFCLCCAEFRHLGHWLSCLGIQLKCSKTRVPWAEDKPMLTSRCNDIGRVYGIIIKIATPIICIASWPIGTLVWHWTDYKSFILPLVGSWIAGLHHTNKGTLCPRFVEVGNIVSLSKGHEQTHTTLIVHNFPNKLFFMIPALIWTIFTSYCIISPS